jgi:hypothetical protein
LSVHSSHCWCGGCDTRLPAGRGTPGEEI